MGLKEQAFGADDAGIERFPIPEWEPEGGEEFYIRIMTGTQRDELENMLDSNPSSPLRKNLRAKIAAWSLCNANGQPVFTIADIQQLGSKSAVVLDRVLSWAQTKSGLTQASVEGIAKNSPAAKSGDSGSS